MLRMAKKKKVRKKSSVRRISPKVKKEISKPKKLVRASQRKISLIFKNLTLFAILFLISFLSYSFLSNELYVNLFFLLTIIFGFIALAFLIVLLIFLILRIMNK